MVTAPHHLISFGYLLAVKYLCKANCQRNSLICVGSSWCQCFDPVDHCRRLETVIDTLGVSNWIKLHRWRILCTCWWIFIQELQTELWRSTGSDLGPVILTFTGCNFVMSSGDRMSTHDYTDDVAVSPDDTEPVSSICILHIKSWMAANFLQLTQDVETPPFISCRVAYCSAHVFSFSKKHLSLQLL